MDETRKAYGVRRRMVAFWIALAVASIGIVMGTPAGYAQNKVKPEVLLPKHYPDGFDGWGRLDSLGAAEVVIDDQVMTLAPDIKYHTPQEMDASPAFFPPGCMVGYMVNNKEEVISLWLIEKLRLKPSERRKPEGPQPRRAPRPGPSEKASEPGEEE